MEYQLSNSTSLFQTFTIIESTPSQVIESLFTHIGFHSLFAFPLESVSYADLLVAKYLLIANNISTIETSEHIIDDLFKASPKELPYIFRAIGVLLRQTQVTREETFVRIIISMLLDYK